MSDFPNRHSHKVILLSSEPWRRLFRQNRGCCVKTLLSPSWICDVCSYSLCRLLSHNIILVITSLKNKWEQPAWTGYFLSANSNRLVTYSWTTTVFLVIHFPGYNATKSGDSQFEELRVLHHKLGLPRDQPDDSLETWWISVVQRSRIQQSDSFLKHSRN